MKLRSVRNAPIKGQRVLLRLDLNVPLSGSTVRDDTRIRAALPTIKLLIEKKAAQIVIISHLGRPHGKPTKAFSLKPVAGHLSKILRIKIGFVTDCVGKPLPSDQIVVLENLRFHNEEEKNNSSFAKKLSMHGDLFVNDAFGTMHRAHASVDAITSHLPSYAGLLVEQEIASLDCLLKPQRPFVAIIGGGKPDKITLLSQLIKRANTVIVGGVLGNVLLKARGEHPGKIEVDRKTLLAAKKICNNPKLIVPMDAICATKPSKIHSVRIVPIQDVPKTHSIYDMGPATMTLIHESIQDARTIFWAGTIGMNEEPHFSSGTNLTARWMAKAKAKTITAGGDTAAAVAKLGLADKMTHVSTGGGAAIAFVEGRKLPGLEPLRKR